MYRPTNDACLMRRVVSPNFCPVCIEGLWIQLLKRVDLVDSISFTSQPSDMSAHKDQLRYSGSMRSTHVTLLLVGLGKYRAHPLQPSSFHDRDVPLEEWSITWTKDGETIKNFANSTTLVANMTGSYEVTVQFFSEEIRKDDHGYTISWRRFTLL